MPITYHERGRYRNLSAVRLLFAANLAFAVLVLIAWQCALLFVLGPINWAANQSIPSATDLMRLFDYPLVLYWAAPMAAMGAAWVMLQAQRYRAAFGILALPVLVMLLTLVMYWAVPVQGH